MKTKLFSFVPLLALIIGFSNTLLAQDVEKKNEYRIKIVKEEDGKKVKIDTTFTSKDEADDFLSKHDMNISDDEMFSTKLDKNADGKKVKKYVIEKEVEGDDEKDVMVFISDDDVVELNEEMDKNVWVVSDDEGTVTTKYIVKSGDDDAAEKKVMVFVGEDGEKTVLEDEVDWTSDENEKIIIKKKKGDDGEDYKTIEVEVEEYKMVDGDEQFIKVEVDDDGNVSITHEDGTIETIKADDAEKEVIIKKVKKSKNTDEKKKVKKKKKEK